MDLQISEVGMEVESPCLFQVGSRGLSPEGWAVIGAKMSLVICVAEEEGALGRGWGNILGVQLGSRLPGVLVSSPFFLLGLALLMCERRKISH